MWFKIRNRFLIWGLVYVFTALLGLLILTFIWLPPGYTMAGHDSGLPLDAKEFLQTRLFAWDDRLGFGVDNSANFGSLTIHFIDYLSSLIVGVPYAGNFISLFFWLGLIYLSGFVFAYQLKDIFGKPFVFILPPFLVFNFYIFQSVFMLERAKFGIFSATLISLAMFLRLKQKKIGVLAAAMVSSLVFSIFNGGGWFGVTLYGGVVIILAVLIFASLIEGFSKRNFREFRETSLFVLLTTCFFILLNAYSILPYAQNFLSNDVPRLIQESSSEGHKDWLNYISRSTSFINLFRLSGVPDWYGEPSEFDKVNSSHPYASFYLNNNLLVFISGVFPLLAFGGLLLAKSKEQRKMVGLFGIITLLELIFAAGSHSPFGILYEFLMVNVPGFFLLRSAFYKFGIFYILGMLVLFSFTLSLLIEKLSVFAGQKWRLVIFPLSIFLVLGLWLGYHWVLLDPAKVFAWKADQSTKMQVPSYVFDFAKWVKENSVDKRVLMVPPVNKDWENDAYNWGYWSLSPLPFTLTSARVLSNWHGLTNNETDSVDNLYNFLKSKDEKSFSELASNLDIGYILLREDVLASPNWSSAEGPESYKLAIESFNGARKVAVFGTWSLYQLEQVASKQVYAVSQVNLISDNFVSLINKFFIREHSVGFSVKKDYPEIEKISANKAYVFDCLSCLLERRAKINSLPSTVIKPGSLLYLFKERREQEILNRTPDSRSKIGNYLGFILTRSAELRQMVDTQESERILLGSVGVIRLYLSNLHSEISYSEENFVNFELLNQVLEYLNPVEREISDYMRGGASKQRSNQFGEEMLGLMWDIRRVKELFSPILENSDRWATEKVYKISFLEGGEYNLIFSSKTFSHDSRDKVILPKLAKFTKDGKEQILQINDREDWLIAEIGSQSEGIGELRLFFNESPNLFSMKSMKDLGLEKFFFGRAACLSGPIENFNKERAYQVMISKTDRLRNVQVFFRDKNKVYSEKHGFFKGEDLFEVASVPAGQLAKYIYFPSATAKDIFVYICSDDSNPPPVDNVIIREFFIPSVISIRKSNTGTEAVPIIQYNSINPSRYEVNVRDIKRPFVLFFNKNFNTSWRLLEENGNRAKVLDKHFMVDDYANGWLVDNTNSEKFIIEYKPQSMFYVGSVISISTVILNISWLIYSGIKFKRKGK